MVPVDAIIKAVATFDIGGVTKAQNVYHFKHITTTEQDDGDVVTAAKNYVQLIMQELQGRIKSDVTMPTVEVYIYESSAWQPLGSEVSSWAGTNTGERLPSGVSLVLNGIKNRTGYRDRKFIAGLTEDSAVGDLWGSATMTAAAAAILKWYSPHSDANGVDLRSVSFDRVTAAVKELTGGYASQKVGYQRRRKPGVGLS